MDKPKFETDNGKFVELAWFKTEAGLTAVIRYAINRNQDSYYCGYVQVPKGSVLDGLQWHEDPNDILESIRDNTQGGDTWIDWSGELSSILDHNTENLGWAFGFDTNHPSFSTSKLACQLSELQEEMIHATYDYIKQQCELLAKKLHKIISKEEVLMEDNNEQPTPTELPWQDISTLKGSGYKGDILIRWDSSSIHYHSNTWKYDIIESYQNEKALSPFSYITHWLPITPPKAPTVEVPVEPERVSVQEFANSGYVTQKQGFWVNSGHGYFKLIKDVSRVGGVEDYNIYVITVIAAGHPIYTTDPSAWLAWKAEQEGKSV